MTAYDVEVELRRIAALLRAGARDAAVSVAEDLVAQLSPTQRRILVDLLDEEVAAQGAGWPA